MRVVASIDLFGALGQPVERRNRQIKVSLLDEFRHLAKEKGDEQGSDMGAIDIGVGHDYDLFVAKVLFLVMCSGAAAERLDKIVELLIAREFVARGAGDVQYFAAQRQDRLVRAIARLLGGAAGGIAFDDKEFRPLRRIIRAIREYSRKPELARRGLARNIFLNSPAQSFLGALDRPVDELRG